MAVAAAQRLDPAALAEAVQRIGDLLGENTGHCAVCGRPVRLIVGGLVPGHFRPTRWGARRCPGGEQPPGEGGESRG